MEGQDRDRGRRFRLVRRPGRGDGQEKGIKLFRDIAETNGFSVRKGHTLLTNLVAAGEVPLALTIFNYTAEQFKKKGAPIDWFTLDPLVAHAERRRGRRQSRRIRMRRC